MYILIPTLSFVIGFIIGSSVTFIVFSLKSSHLFVQEKERIKRIVVKELQEEGHVSITSPSKREEAKRLEDELTR